MTAPYSAAMPWAHLVGPRGLSLRAARKVRVAAEKLNRNVLTGVARLSRIAARTEPTPAPFSFAEALAVTVPTAAEIEREKDHERSRCKRIVMHGVEHAQTTVAFHLAFKGGMPASAAIDLLDSLRSVQCIGAVDRDRPTGSVSTPPFLSRGETATQIIAAGRKASGEQPPAHTRSNTP
jgi:hypothetical protein